jgi:hypothetical protein
MILGMLEPQFWLCAHEKLALIKIIDQKNYRPKKLSTKKIIDHKNYRPKWYTSKNVNKKLKCKEQY